MGSVGRVVATAAVGLALAGAPGVGTIQVYVDGKLRGAFAPRGEPYASDGPSVSVFLEKRAVKTADGRVPTGFEFMGWQEGQGVRVQVFLLVPAEGEANAYLPEGKSQRVARRHFSSMLLAKGDEVLLDKMRELGLEPIKVRLR